MTATILAERLENIKQSNNGWWSAKAPCHDDQRNSFTFKDGDRGVIVKCHAGCAVDKIADALGCTVADLFFDHDTPSTKPRPRIVATYDYCDEEGALLYQVVREEPKTFKQRRPDGRGGLIWNLNDTRRVLYRLPDLQGHATVHLVEGEKDAERLWSLGLAATTNAGGAGKWTDDYTAQLVAAGVRHIRIVPDNDVPGWNHGQGVAASGHAAGLTVKVVRLPGLPALKAKHGEDVSDWLDAGHTPEELEAAVGATTAWTPEPPRAAPSSPPGPSASSEFHLTDLGNSLRLVARHGQDLRFCRALGWLAWNGTRWEPSEDAAMRLAKETALAMYEEAATVVDSEARKALATHALKTEADPRLRAMLSLAESEAGISIESDVLDRNAWLLNCANGVLDLKTADLRPHTRELFMTKLVPVPYDLHAPCPQWEHFLDRVFAGDAQLIAFVQRAVGYSLTGDTSEQVLFVLHGLGANGKSTFVKTLMHVLADYALNTPTATLLVKRDDPISTDLARLAGARFVSAVEIEGGRRLAESLVKSLTGGDTISARFLYRNSFDFTPCCKIWLACNHRPVIRGTDEAIWRRVRLIPFNVTIPEPERDPHLLDKLRAEAPGILQWALEGCVAWQQIRLGLPEAVKQASATYRAEQDVLAEFVRDCCLIAPDAVESAKDLYRAYAEWCDQSGEQPLTKRILGLMWQERGFASVMARNERAWRGVRLRLPTDPDAPAPTSADAREEYHL